MEFGDYVIFVDESGDHSLSSIDDSYPIFVLDFCIFRKDHYINDIVPRIEAFKFKHFGHDIVVLHERDIRKQSPPFVFLKDPQRRDSFMRDLSALIDQARFTLVATVIDKKAKLAQYSRPENPYDLALLHCMEQAHGFLESKGHHAKTTHVIVERRGRREDAELEFVFRRIRDGDSRKGKMSGFELVFADKRVNSSGLQLADLTARPIGRHFLDPEQPNRAWEVVEPKFRRSSSGQIEGWGLKFLP